MVFWLARPAAAPAYKVRSLVRHAIPRCLALFQASGPYFVVKLTAKHLVVVASQTYRAYSTSALVGVSAIITVFSSLDFVYDVVVPLLWQLVASNFSRTSRRSYTIAATVALNFTANVLLPTWILRPYYDYFGRSDMTKLQYHDTFYHVGVSVCQSILITSPVDLAVTATRHVFLWKAINDFLRSFHTLTRQHVTVIAARRRTSSLSKALDAVARGVQARLTHYLDIFVVVGYALSILWALAVLALSLASMHAPPCRRGCLAQTYPWLTGKCACTVLETTSDATNTLELPLGGGLETTSLVFLIISHCPRLTMPPAIQALTNLIGLEIYNSTVVAWGAEASLEFASRLSYVQLVRTNMTDLPMGLFHNAPPTFIDLEVSVTNLAAISLDASYLPQLMVLYLEHGQLTAFPPQLIGHNLNELSLLGNAIAALPPNVSMLHVNYFQVSCNPVATVPEAVLGLPNLWELYIDSTEVAELSPTSMAQCCTSLAPTTRRSVQTPPTLRVPTHW